MTLELLKSQTGRTLIESHRGVEADVPENSWSAIELGHRLGADLIELDVQMSHDGVAFLRHNYQLPGGRWCHDLTWKELEQIRIDDESLPLLEDVLAWARGAGIILSLDIKSIFQPDFVLTREVVRCLERTNTKEDMLLLFMDHSELYQAKSAHPELTVRALLIGRLMSYCDYLRGIQADSVSISYGMFRPQDVDEIHSAGIAVALSSVWNAETDLFHSLDIDIFSHGNPAEARKILDRQLPQ
jgi:glycerophosphoryl diester phosphodiesterase